MSRISGSSGSLNPPNHLKPPDSLNRLLSTVVALRGGEVGKLVCARIKEFEAALMGEHGKIFEELCFCILTANFNAEKSIKIQSEIGGGFLTLVEPQLARKLKELGHRYPNVRAKYIVEARKHKNSLKDVILSCDDEHGLREWLVKNIKGIGYKEASHFIRNIGYKNSAIVDFHIIDLLVRSGSIERPKTLTKAKYLEIEGVLGALAAELDMNLAELDLYLWFIETGTVLK
ncbi:MAG: N-glycosylase/DNA lyase [Methanosarcinales archaeon]|nr:N-glycosylase/DNA lyase [Methanosarcinales archaeon]